MNNKGFTVVELITSFSLTSVIMLILFNVIIIMKDNLSEVNAKTKTLMEKDNLSYNLNKRLKEKELTSLTMCEDGDKCYLFTYSDSTSDKLVYSNTDKTITFNNYTFDITDDMNVETPIITEHYDTMSSTEYDGYFIINIPITVDNNDYSIKTVKYFNAENLVIDFPEYIYDNSNNKYTPVEYIESTGTQYIDSNVNYSYNTKIDLTIQSVSSVADVCGLYKNGYWTYGIRVRNNVYEGTWIYNLSARGTNALEVFTSNINYSSKVNIVLDKTGMEINNNKISATKSKEFSTLNVGISFGNVKEVDSNSLVSNSTDVKFFSVKMYESDVLVRDYIPVINSSNRPCLFDKVSKTCFYNQGTGEFLYG